MSVRETSIEVYHQIRDEGLLSAMRFAVYDAVFRYGPCTCSELCDRMKMLPSNASPRLTELRDLGVVKELGTAPCPITGREVILWDVTDKLPQDVSRKHYKPRKDVLMAAVLDLKAEATIRMFSHDTMQVIDWLEALCE